MEEIDEVIGYDGITTEEEEESICVPAISSVTLSESKCEEFCCGDIDKVRRLRAEFDSLKDIGDILSK